MGYTTIVNVPYIDGYGDALAKWQSTKPIRGRTPEVRPLGQRRDCDTYSIRKNVWTEAIECVLYMTPVLKFTTDNEVIINFGSWSSSSTCQFIEGVLRSVSASRKRNTVVLGFRDGTNAILERGEELVLVNGARGWTAKAKQTLYDYRVNRKEANKVRKSVSQFRDYLKGIVKLKAEVVAGVYGRGGFSAVNATYAELIEVFGKEEMASRGGFRPDIAKWVKLGEKPVYCAADSKAGHWSNYRERALQFYDLVKNNQDDNVRHQNYWLAFNILFVQIDNFYWRTDENLRMGVATHYFEKFLDKALLTMFADKVFTKIALPDGKVPSGVYDNYVLEEEN